MRNYILIFSLFTVLFSGCSKFYQYDIQLKTVNDNTKNITPSDALNTYEDEFINIKWAPSCLAFFFELQNKTDSPIVVLWDDVVYAERDNYCLKVIHSDDKSDIILSKCKIKDYVYPPYYINVTYYELDSHGLFPKKYTDDDDFKDIKNKYIGKTIKIFMPIKIENAIYDYNFTFEIKDISIYSTTLKKSKRIRNEYIDFKPNKNK